MNTANAKPKRIKKPTEKILIRERDNKRFEKEESERASLVSKSSSYSSFKENASIRATSFFIKPEYAKDFNHLFTSKNSKINNNNNEPKEKEHKPLKVKGKQSKKSTKAVNAKSSVKANLFPTSVPYEDKDSTEPIITLPTPVRRTERYGTMSKRTGDQPESMFIQLPEKIRVKIFKFLTYDERHETQLVCRRFRNDIRLRVGLQVLVTAATEQGLTNYRDLLIDSIIVGRYDRPSMSPTRLIMLPENVIQLAFEEPISAHYLDAFLLRCRFIRYLIIRDLILFDFRPVAPAHKSANQGANNAMDPEWRTIEAMQKNPPTLDNLKRLKFHLRVNDNERIHLHSTLCRTLKWLNFPNLRRLAIIINGLLDSEAVKAIHLSVFSFLLKNPYISRLLVSTEPRKEKFNWLRTQPAGISKEDLSSLASVLRFKELICTESIVKFHTWSLILSFQTKLEVLQILHLMHWVDIRHVVGSNYQSLRVIALHVLLSTSGGKYSLQIDLNDFNVCNALEELYINLGSPSTPGKPDLMNFHKLPHSLKVFALKKCTFRTRDLMQISFTLPKLESLGVSSLGSCAGFGVDASCLKTLITMRSLSELLISGFAVNEQSQVEELEELLQILQMERKGKSILRSSIHIWSETESGVCRWLTGQDGTYLFVLQSNWAF